MSLKYLIRLAPTKVHPPELFDLELYEHSQLDAPVDEPSESPGANRNRVVIVVLTAITGILLIAAYWSGPTTGTALRAPPVGDVEVVGSSDRADGLSRMP